MTLLSQLSDKERWESFYEYKTTLAVRGSFETELRGFIDRADFLPVCRAIEEGAPCPLPVRSVISKMSSQKKRVVYTYPEPWNTVFKMLTWLLLRKYDGIFADNLWSFRPGRTAKEAVKKLAAAQDRRGLYSYKADVSDYFNSIPVPLMTAELGSVLKDDVRLRAFLCGLLRETRVCDRGTVKEERKGIMAGTPLAAFYANVFLRELDRRFETAGIPYARYSDDIILFAATPEERDGHAAYVRSFLADRGLAVNPSKETFASPEDGWVFLGFSYRRGKIDIAPASVKKLKGKMRRKTRALKRWSDRGGHGGEKAAKAFIRIFNRKLFENAGENDLTWARWYFPALNTTDGLRRIDAYAQECVRYLLTGTRTKARFNARYADLKALGYRSLVHEYYGFRSSPREET